MLRVERSVHWADTERDLDRVTTPTLILWGDQDQYFPVRLLNRFTRRLPNAEAHVVTGAGHSLSCAISEAAVARVRPGGHGWS